MLIIGDIPRVWRSDRQNTTRLMLTAEQTRQRQTYFEQAGKVLDTVAGQAEYAVNKEWLAIYFG